MYLHFSAEEFFSCMKPSEKKTTFLVFLHITKNKELIKFKPLVLRSIHV